MEVSEEKAEVNSFKPHVMTALKSQKVALHRIRIELDELE